MAKKRLIGRDGDAYSVTMGTVVNGDGTKTLDNGYYVATAKGASSGLPQGLEVGYVFKGSSAVTPAEGDTIVPLELKKRCDIRNFSIEYNADEIDVTTLCDGEKSYRAGFIDASGSMEGVTTIDVSEDLMNKFMPIVTQGAALTDVEIKEVNNEPLIVKLELNGIAAGGDVLSYFAPIAITSYSIGATIDSEQTFTSNFRITPNDLFKPALLKEVANA